MADEDIELGNALEAASPDEMGEPKKKRFISDKIARVLVYVASGIIAIILTITISVVTFRVLDKGSVNRSFAEVSQAYETIPEPYTYYTLIPQIRGVTRDQSPHSVIVKVDIGYKEGDSQVQTELVARTAQLTDIIRNYFSQKTAAELAPEREHIIKTELKDLVNRVLSQGKVQDIIFPELQVYEF